ncbi:MAG: AEC family transporter [Atopobium sp.]|nr:AEC family transporter [Atopobium sp.]
MSVFLTSLQNVLPIILIIVLGYILRKINWLNETFAGQASKLIMNVALPASIFVAVLKNLSLNQLLQLGHMLQDFWLSTFFASNQVAEA